MRYSPAAVATLLALLLPAATLAYTLVETSDGVPVHWEVDDVSFVLDSAGTSELPFAQVQRALEGSVEAWDDVPDSGLRLVYAGAVDDEPVGYQPDGNLNLVAFVASGWSYGSETLAVTLTTWALPSGRLLDADIAVNTRDYEWAVDGRPGRMDLASALTHELGHAVGLGHSEYSEATMFASIVPGDLGKRELEIDDLNGLLFLYSVAEVIEPEPDPNPPTEPADDPPVEPDAPSTPDDPGVGEEPNDDPSGSDDPPADAPTSPTTPRDSPADQAGPQAPAGAPSGETPSLPTVAPRRDSPTPASSAPGLACSAAPGRDGAAPVGWIALLLGALVVRQRTAGRQQP